MTTPPPPPVSRRIGLSFWLLFWSLALALAVWRFGVWQQQRAFANLQPQSHLDAERAELTLRADPRGHYQLLGRINGVPVHFLIDTGATQVTVPASLATELGLPALGAGWARTANGPARVTRTRIERLELGPLQLTDVAATLMPAMDGPVLLGMSALGPLQLWHRNGTLTLSQSLPRSP